MMWCKNRWKIVFRCVFEAHRTNHELHQNRIVCILYWGGWFYFMSFRVAVLAVVVVVGWWVFFSLLHSSLQLIFIYSFDIWLWLWGIFPSSFVSFSFSFSFGLMQPICLSSHSYAFAKMWNYCDGGAVQCCKDFNHKITDVWCVHVTQPTGNPVAKWIPVAKCWNAF